MSGKREGSREVLSSIRIGDGALTTDALQLTSLDGREATAGLAKIVRRSVTAGGVVRLIEDRTLNNSI